MKISGLEKGILALTLAFLLLTVGYSFLCQVYSEPYSVSVQTVWTGETGAAEQEQEQAAAADTEKVNINTATAEQLQTLPGIGPVRAEAIIAERESNGPFRLPEDIVRVSGIGQETLEKILEYITVK